MQISPLAQRLVPRKDRRPPRAAYALPTIFTAGNIFLGFAAIAYSLQAATRFISNQPGWDELLAIAAKCIGIAIVLDGLDGRIARMTNTVSDFGRELDSLADVITFGIAPAVLAFVWGVEFVEPPLAGGLLQQHIMRGGYFAAFAYLMCGAARLARFNVSTNPVPKNPGRPDRKYFVGLPIPAAAGMVAAVVFAFNWTVVRDWYFSVVWVGLLLLLAFLMVSTWRYRSFKDINLLRPRSPLTAIMAGCFIYLIWNWPEPVLLAMAILYVGSGIAIRAGGIVRRLAGRKQPPAAPAEAEPRID
jgi:CDP-diacylglycerol---serine O-phosphatidyltransferase